MSPLLHCTISFCNHSYLVLRLYPIQINVVQNNHQLHILDHSWTLILCFHEPQNKPLPQTNYDHSKTIHQNKKKKQKNKSKLAYIKNYLFTEHNLTKNNKITKTCIKVTLLILSFSMCAVLCFIFATPFVVVIIILFLDLSKPPPLVRIIRFQKLVVFFVFECFKDIFHFIIICLITIQ